MYICKKIHTIHLTILNINNMKTKAILFFLMLLPAEVSLSQSMIWQLPSIPADTTIVREWRDGKYLVYNRNSSGQTVSLHDNSSPVVRTAQIPSSVTINDFRIANDTVFAGGTVPGAIGIGILACFDINDLSGSYGQFYVLPFNLIDLHNSTCTTYTNPPTNCSATGVKRIETFQDGPLTRVAYIADDTIMDGGGSGGCHRVGYGEASFNGGAWTTNSFHYNKDAVNQFSDIAVTDNHVVVVSSDCLYQRLELVVHTRMADFAFLSPTPGCDIYYSSDHKVLGRVMACALTGDSFAVAYHYKTSAGIGLAVKMFDISAGVPSLLHSIEIPLGAAYEMRDIRHVPGNNELWMLHDAASPLTGTAGSYIYRIDLANVYAGTYKASFIPGYPLHSLDNLLGQGLIASGRMSGTLSVYSEQNTSAVNSCAASEYVKGQKTYPVVRMYGRHHCTYIPIANTNTYQFTVYEEPAEKICSFEKGGIEQ